MPQSRLLLVASLEFSIVEPHRFRHIHSGHYTYDWILHLAQLAGSPDLYNSQGSHISTLHSGCIVSLVVLPCAAMQGCQGRDTCTVSYLGSLGPVLTCLAPLEGQLLALLEPSRPVLGCFDHKWMCPKHRQFWAQKLRKMVPPKNVP